MFLVSYGFAYSHFKFLIFCCHGLFLQVFCDEFHEILCIVYPMHNPIQGTAIVVIHPGSFYLRIGRASDTFPHTIPHVIARRCKSGTVTKYEDSLLVADTKLTPEIQSTMIGTRNAISDVLASCLTSDGISRYATLSDHVVGHNVKSRPDLLHGSMDLHWTKVDTSQDYVVGEEVLYLNPREKFNIHWPIRRGRLNLHSGVGGSLSSILCDLETIWGSAISQCLDIPLKDLRHYRAVLVISDIYDHQHVKEMVTILLTKLGFGGCFVHQESVCATFGAGLSCACVVDVGDQKTSVSCVEDGISHRNTRLVMDYGGSDITQIFHWLLRKSGFPYKQCNPRNPVDGLLLHELKENLCHVNLDITGPQLRTFQVKHPGQAVIQYKMHVGDDCTIACLGLFHPDLFSLTGAKQTHMQQRSQGDPEDPHDENYLRETTQRRGARENFEAGQNPDVSITDEGQLTGAQIEEEIDPTDVAAPNIVRDAEKELQCDQLLSLDQAILTSVDRCGNDDMKRRLYSCILIVGGGMLFTGIHTWLQNRLSMQIPIVYRAEQMDIIVRPKDMDPRNTCWKGAAIMSCLDTAQELWIRQREWHRFGVKVLRERAPFIW